MGVTLLFIHSCDTHTPRQIIDYRTACTRTRLVPRSQQREEGWQRIWNQQVGQHWQMNQNHTALLSHLVFLDRNLFPSSFFLRGEVERRGGKKKTQGGGEKERREDAGAWAKLAQTCALRNLHSQCKKAKEQKTMKENDQID